MPGNRASGPGAVGGRWLWMASLCAALVTPAAAGSWAQQRTAPAAGGRRMIAVDGKTLRGSGTADDPGRHLLAALDHAHGVVLGQVGVEAKTNEIPMFAAVLDRIDLTGAVVTADALHAQRAHAEYLVTRRHAHYLITVKHGAHCSRL